MCTEAGCCGCSAGVVQKHGRRPHLCMMPFQSQLLTANIILQEGYFLTVLSLKEEKKQTDNGMKDSDEPLMEEEEEEEKK